MNFVRNIFRFFIYSNLFIAFCALIMVYQTYDLLLHDQPPLSCIGFIFFGTICSYSFHWYLTPSQEKPATDREHWLMHNRWVHAVLYFIGLAGATVSAFFLWDHWHWLLLSVFITFLYSAPKIPHPFFRILRKAALAKTIFLAFVWMYVTTILPLEISDHPWQASFSLFAISRFFLIYAICILFDYRDREYDRQIGIRSLITWLSFENITRLFVLSLVFFAFSTCLLLKYDLSVWTVALLLLPGLITAMLYRHACRNFSDVLYYFTLDGLMALSSVMTILAFH